MSLCAHENYREDLPKASYKTRAEQWYADSFSILDGSEITWPKCSDDWHSRLFAARFPHLSLIRRFQGKEDSKSDSFTRKDVSSKSSLTASSLALNVPVNQLRDIFRIHPDTACNTHELLQCPCGRIDAPNDEDEDDTRGSDSSGVLTEDDESEGGRGFVHASSVRVDQLNRWDKEVGIPCLESLGNLIQFTP